MSEWSHAALQIGPTIFEVTMRDGVTLTSLEEFRERYPTSTMLKVDGDEYKAASWLRNQIGKEYDYSGLIGFAIQRDWQEPSKWFCSELIAEALLKAGTIHPKIKASRITPRDLWLLISFGDYDHD